MSWLQWFTKKPMPRREFLETAIKRGGVTVLSLSFAPGIVVLSGGATHEVPGEGRVVGFYSDTGGGTPTIPITTHDGTIGPVREPLFNEDLGHQTVEVGGQPGTVEWKSGHPPEALSTGPFVIEHNTDMEGTAPGEGGGWFGPNAVKLCEASADLFNAGQIARAKAAGVDVSSSGFLAEALLRCFLR